MTANNMKKLFASKKELTSNNMTEHLTILVTENPCIDTFYVVRKRGFRECQIVKCSVGMNELFAAKKE